MSNLDIPRALRYLKWLLSWWWARETTLSLSSQCSNESRLVARQQSSLDVDDDEDTDTLRLQVSVRATGPDEFIFRFDCNERMHHSLWACRRRLWAADR